MRKRIPVRLPAVLAAMLACVPATARSAQDLVLAFDGPAAGDTPTLFHLDLDAALAQPGSGLTGLFNYGGLVTQFDAIDALPNGNVVFGAGADVTALGGGTNDDFLVHLEVETALAAFDDGMGVLISYGGPEVVQAVRALSDGSVVAGCTYGGGLLSHIDPEGTRFDLIGGAGSFVDIVETSPGHIVWAANSDFGSGMEGHLRHTDLAAALAEPQGSGVGTTELLGGFGEIFALDETGSGALYSSSSFAEGLLTFFTAGAFARSDLGGGLAPNGDPMAPLEALANGNVMVAIGPIPPGLPDGSLLSYDAAGTQLAPHSKFSVGEVTRLIELADGNAVYALREPSHPQDEVLVHLDTAAGTETHILTEAESEILEMVPLADGNFVFASTAAGGNLSHVDVPRVFTDPAGARTTLAVNLGDVQALVALPIPPAPAAPAFVSIDRTGPGSVRLAWESRDPPVYTVESADNPEGPWSHLAGPLNDAEYEDAAAAGPGRFYRVSWDENAATILFEDDFESGPGDWSPGTEPTDNWELGVPVPYEEGGTTNGPSAAVSGSHVWATGLGEPYATGDPAGSVVASLRSPVIDLTGVTEATLSFQSWIEVEENFDFARLEIVDADTEENLGRALDRTGESIPWYEEIVDLAPYAGRRIRLVFDVSSDDLIPVYGWAVDDVLVTSP